MQADQLQCVDVIVHRAGSSYYIVQYCSRHWLKRAYKQFNANRGGQRIRGVQRKQGRTTQNKITQTGAYNANRAYGSNKGVQRKQGRTTRNKSRTYTFLSHCFNKCHQKLCLKSRNLRFYYINCNDCATQTKNNWSNSKTTFLGYTVFAMWSFSMVLLAPVCDFLCLYALYALVRACLLLSALFSHTPIAAQFFCCMGDNQEPKKYWHVVKLNSTFFTVYQRNTQFLFT